MIEKITVNLNWMMNENNGGEDMNGLQSNIKSYSELRIAANKERRLKIVRRQRMIAAFIATFFVTLTVFFGTTLLSEAQNEDYVPMCKYYKVVVVHAGDTLNSIANKYFAEDEYRNFEAYTSEICRINHLDSADEIKAGENVIVPYYAEYEAE